MKTENNNMRMRHVAEAQPHYTHFQNFNLIFRSYVEYANKVGQQKKCDGNLVARSEKNQSIREDSSITRGPGLLFKFKNCHFLPKKWGFHQDTFDVRVWAGHRTKTALKKSIYIFFP